MSSLFTLNVCHLHHPLSNCTASEFTTKLWSGWVPMMVWTKDALEWRWKVDNNQIVPIMTDMKAAPNNLLKMIIAIANRVHLTVVAGDMGYHAMLDVDHAKLIHVTTHTTIT